MVETAKRYFDQQAIARFNDECARACPLIYWRADEIRRDSSLPNGTVSVPCSIQAPAPPKTTLNVSMDPDIPVTVSLTGPEAELLDRAIDNFTSPIPESRPDFVLACVRYGLLALAEEGILNLEVEGEIPGFVAWYRDVVKHRTSGDTHSPCL